jgi:hypothetical protein
MPTIFSTRKRLGQLISPLLPLHCPSDLWQQDVLVLVPASALELIGLASHQSSFHVPRAVVVLLLPVEDISETKIASNIRLLWPLSFAFALKTPQRRPLSIIEHSEANMRYRKPFVVLTLLCEEMFSDINFIASEPI